MSLIGSVSEFRNDCGKLMGKWLAGDGHLLVIRGAVRTYEKPEGVKARQDGKVGERAQPDLDIEDTSANFGPFERLHHWLSVDPA